MGGKILFSVFTKPWPTVSLPELGKFVSDLGFDGIELPVRPGYQVAPENVNDLVRAAKALAKFDVQILSVAGPADEASEHRPRAIPAIARSGSSKTSRLLEPRPRNSRPGG